MIVFFFCIKIEIIPILVTYIQQSTFGFKVSYGPMIGGN